jgi:hypothetical protein
MVRFDFIFNSYGFSHHPEGGDCNYYEIPAGLRKTLTLLGGNKKRRYETATFSNAVSPAKITS